MFSALSHDIVNYVHTALLEIQTNEKLFVVIKTMDEDLKHQNLSKISA